MSEQASVDFSRLCFFELTSYSLLQLDSNSRVQYEKGPKRPCNPEMVSGPHFCNASALCSNLDLAGTWVVNQDFDPCGKGIVEEQMP